MNYFVKYLNAKYLYFFLIGNYQCSTENKNIRKLPVNHRRYMFNYLTLQSCIVSSSNNAICLQACTLNPTSKSQLSLCPCPVFCHRFKSCVFCVTNYTLQVSLDVWQFCFSFVCHWHRKRVIHTNPMGF